MAATEKDLGAVTAYAQAVEGGYTGTKAEFEAALQRGSIRAYSYGIRGGYSFDMRARDNHDFATSVIPYPNDMIYGVTIEFIPEAGGLFVYWNWSTPV